jgi:hypothetical protein
VRPSVLPNISRQTLIPNTVAEGPLFTIPESDPNESTTLPFVIPIVKFQDILYKT